MKQAARSISRRNFLLAAAGGSAAATAALLTQRATEGSKSGGNTNKAGSAGYHVTEHIRNYYRTAKV